ncbi:MAG: DUF3014 domain-containing protein [Gammaproteobacteria bacterium]|nr:DUF3014 domain-containing protein [Gammaproteobacteria bacterium]
MWEEDLEDKARRKVRWLIGIVAAALLVGAGAYWFASRHRAENAAAAVIVPSAAPGAASQIQHPLPEGEGGGALPALNDSDPVAHDSLAGVLGQDTVEQFLVPQNIVRHIVVTVDNLPRRRVAVELRPVKPTAGQPATAVQGDITTLSEANFARYAPLVHVVQGADVKALVLVYRRLYPLFQQAYEDLGYPGKYFNDRMVEAIDNLLESPEITTPIQVVQPRVTWEYADAALESRSAGQKLLIRMGPANARIIKAKLRAFRAEIARQP